MVKSIFMQNGEYRQESHGTFGEAIAFLVAGRDSYQCFPIGIYEGGVLHIHEVANDLISDVENLLGISGVEVKDLDLDV